jgi:hypothetical protein
MMYGRVFPLGRELNTVPAYELHPFLSGPPEATNGKPRAVVEG